MRAQIRRIGSITNMISELDGGSDVHVNYFSCLSCLPTVYLRQILREIIEEVPEARERIIIEASKAHEAFDAVLSALDEVSIKNAHSIKPLVTRALSSYDDEGKQSLARALALACELSATVDVILPVQPALFVTDADAVFSSVITALNVLAAEVAPLDALDCPIPLDAVRAVCKMTKEWPRIVSYDETTCERWNIPAGYMKPENLTPLGLVTLKALQLMERWHHYSHSESLTPAMVKALHAMPGLPMVPRMVARAIEDIELLSIEHFAHAVADAVDDDALVAAVAAIRPTTADRAEEPPIEEHRQSVPPSAADTIAAVHIPTAPGNVVRHILTELLRRHVALQPLSDKLDKRLHMMLSLEQHWGALDKLMDLVDVPESVIAERLLAGIYAAVGLVEEHRVLHERALVWLDAGWHLVKDRNIEKIQAAFAEQAHDDRKVECILMSIMGDVMSDLIQGDRVVDDQKIESLLVPILNEGEINGTSFLSQLRVDLAKPGRKHLATVLLPLIPDLCLPAQINYPVPGALELANPDRVRSEALSLARAVMVEEDSIADYETQFTYSL
ncbi:hypothetical protein J8273_3532 [Carpediemonas membranifera]|uniref:Uncharacterized protein n=1 Tax=Carpediemonas membranifera TaxID=201153 RepID=A0A8J6BXE6_9EUKA|nr:hypothetical protein J8273_3532 [Carpediemonas membranifera]|eukprot:KAG9393396.1 hypothetical protein J8273_3532 [Carpediemonas membranifera]